MKWYLLIFPVLFILSCKKKHDVTTNPCAGQTPTSAKFNAYVNLAKNGLVISTDTFYADKGLLCEVKLSVLDTNIEDCQWQIGQEASFRSGKSVIVDFQDTYGQVPVKCMVKKNVSKCFPNDKGVDTFIRNIYILSPRQMPILGKYLGSDDVNPAQKYLVSIYSINGLQYDPLYIDNFPSGCDLDSAHGKELSPAIAWNNKLNKFYMQCNRCSWYCQIDSCTGTLASDNRTLIINYRLRIPDSAGSSFRMERRVFTGYKQN
jgi:hypothetical protein